jgi:hypothetical protein
MEGENHMKKDAIRPHRLIITRIFIVSLCILSIAIAFYALLLTSSQTESQINPTGRIILEIPYSKYQVDETISYQIKNNFNSSIKVPSNCPNEPLAVYKLVNTSWVRQHERVDGDNCLGSNNIIIVASGGIIKGDFGLWHNLFSEPGKYRVVADIDSNGVLPYQDFEVVSKSSSSDTNAQLTKINSSQNSTSPTQSTTVPAVIIPQPSTPIDNRANDD